MKFLKQTLTLSMLLMGLSPMAQTKEIAWKSHSGKMHHFNPKQDGDLGLFIPPTPLVSVEKVNDTTFIEFYANDLMPEYNHFDTVYNHPIWMKPQSDLDSLIPIHYPNITLTGFNRASSTVQPVLKKTTNSSRK